jgi:proteic killer suppression protein
MAATAICGDGDRTSPAIAAAARFGQSIAVWSLLMAGAAQLILRLDSIQGQSLPPITQRVIMIQSFADAETSLVWTGRRSRRLPSDIQSVALRKLRLLNQARNLNDLRIPPGNRLEALKADRQGQHSIRINDQWRICFVWDEGGPRDVQIVDYHG